MEVEARLVHQVEQSPGALIMAVGEGGDRKSGVTELLAKGVTHSSAVATRDAEAHVRCQEMTRSTEVGGHRLPTLEGGEGVSIRGVSSEELGREPVAREPSLATRVGLRKGIHVSVQPVTHHLLDLGGDGSLQAAAFGMAVACHGYSVVKRPRHGRITALIMQHLPRLLEGCYTRQVGTIP